jgi:hypothetical protein
MTLYTALATQQSPALIIYLLDVSASMAQPLGEKRRIDVVMDALTAALRTMVFRSTRGGRLSPRYRLAMFAYSDQVYDLLGGVRPIDQVAPLGVPELNPLRVTETSRAFAAAERLLEEELPRLSQSPAPLICHMTDGEWTGEDPRPIVRRIRQMAVPDGPVLVANIFISDQVVPHPTDPSLWPGILPETPLLSSLAEALREISSPIPESYRAVMRESGMHLASGALMLFPGTSPELVSLGFQLSAATPIRL